jgi:AraC-like DNA-binding protein
MMRHVVLPVPPLRACIRNIMIGEFTSTDSHLPATPDAQLVIYLQGSASLLEPESAAPMPLAFIAGPCMTPRRFRVDIGSRFIGVTFRPTGLSACFGMPANLFFERIVALEDALPQDTAARLTNELYGAASMHAAVEAVEAFLMRSLQGGGKREPALPALGLERLLMPAAALADGLSLGTRQLERRFLVNYGMPLRDCRRLARFSSVLAQLLTGTPAAVSMARIAVDAHYVDQAHFIRDFRQFVGDTPGRFLRAKDEEDSIYSLWRLNPAELHSFID